MPPMQRRAGGQPQVGLETQHRSKPGCASGYAYTEGAKRSVYTFSEKKKKTVLKLH